MVDPTIRHLVAMLSWAPVVRRDHPAARRHSRGLARHRGGFGGISVIEGRLVLREPDFLHYSPAMSELREKYGSAKHPERPVAKTRAPGLDDDDGRGARKIVRGARSGGERPRASLRIPPDVRDGRSDAAGGRPTASRPRATMNWRTTSTRCWSAATSSGNVDVPARRGLRRAVLAGVSRRRTGRARTSRRGHPARVRGRDEARRTDAAPDPAED